jgi:hypothetical protein
MTQSDHSKGDALDSLSRLGIMQHWAGEPGTAMDELGGWLRKLGLEQYEAAFRENAISDKVLPNLTAEDLKDLGVGMVGHRRMLLEAIAALRVDADAKTAPAVARSPKDRFAHLASTAAVRSS